MSLGAHSSYGWGEDNWHTPNNKEVAAVIKPKEGCLLIYSNFYVPWLKHGDYALRPTGGSEFVLIFTVHSQ